MKFNGFSLILFFVGGLLSDIGAANEERIQQELAESTEIIPPLRQALGEDAFNKAMASGEHTYAGNAKCRLCHRDFFVGRKADVHDHAYEKLVAAGAEYAENARCLNCHATGYGVANGFRNIKKTPRLANVQCEGCHGPGNVHIRREVVRMPAVGLSEKPEGTAGGFLAGTDRPEILKKMCKSCHTQRWNRAFDDFDKAYNSYKTAKPGSKNKEIP